ncbi:MAG: hypothetical protein J6Y16_09180 [Treponema sp.]|nr:hypothetical protein [Treponema sp.]
MKKTVYFATDYYDRQVIESIIEKYNLNPLEAAKSFIMSKTHAMLEDEEYGLLSMPTYEVFDMWEEERITGDPRNSVYVRGE